MGFSGMIYLAALASNYSNLKCNGAFTKTSLLSAEITAMMETVARVPVPLRTIDKGIPLKKLFADNICNCTYYL